MSCSIPLSDEAAAESPADTGVFEVCLARPFGTHHARADRVDRRARGSKQLAMVRRRGGRDHLSAQAAGMFDIFGRRKIEPPLRIELLKFLAQGQPRIR